MGRTPAIYASHRIKPAASQGPKGDYWLHFRHSVLGFAEDGFEGTCNLTDCAHVLGDGGHGLILGRRRKKGVERLADWESEEHKNKRQE